MNEPTIIALELFIRSPERPDLNLNQQIKKI